MRGTTDWRGLRVTPSSDLEAEVEACRRKRTRRPISMTCDVTVIRVCRRLRPASLSGLPPRSQPQRVGGPNASVSKCPTM